jgi:putative copper resistance protein D
VNNSTPAALKNRAVLGLLALLAFGTLAAVLGLRLGGGAEPSLLQDSGEVVRWGLPLIKGLANISMAVTIGSLALACFATANSSWQLRRLQNLVAAAAAVWAVASLLVVLFTYLSVTGLPLSLSETFGAGLWMFISSIALGQSLALNALAGALVAIAVLMVEKLSGTLLVLGLALAGLVPLAVSGHASGTQGHSMAVNAIGLHLLAVTVWVGGLVALLALKSQNANENRILASRYSSLALLAYLVVAVSGIASASVRITSLDMLASGYGQLVLLKSITLVLLGVFGAWYRVRLFRSPKGMTSFWSLALAEL